MKKLDELREMAEVEYNRGVMDERKRCLKVLNELPIEMTHEIDEFMDDFKEALMEDGKE